MSAQQAADDLYACLFGDRDSARNDAERTASPELSDEDVLRLARDARNGAKFSALWAGDRNAHDGTDRSDSAAELALVGILAFYTRDREQLARLLRRSGLYRPKMDRDDYVYATVDKALAGGGATFGDDTSRTRDRHDAGEPSDYTNARAGDSDAEPAAPDDEPAGRRKPSQAEVLVSLALDAGAELFHDPDSRPYARIDIGGHRETHRVTSSAFRQWLGRLFHASTGKVPGSQGVQDALNVLSGQALFDGPEISVHVRIAAHDGAVYVDLADDAWRVIRVTAAGWDVCDDPPVRFRRPRGMASLPMPERGGSLGELRPFLNCLDDDAWALIRGYILQAARPQGPFLILNVQGEQGSGKTNVGRVTRSLVDPATPALRRPPRDERDLYIAATNAQIVGFDNLSGVKDWLSDALAVLATGGGAATRELYSDSEEMIFNVTRPILLTGIGDVITRGDLIDRTVFVTLPPIPDDQRRPESEYWRDVDAIRPRVLGAIFDHIARGLRDEPSVQLERLPRMADVARWVYACEGPEQGARFLQAYERNRAAANDLILEDSPFARVLVEWFGERLAVGLGVWTGTATELLKVLNEHAGPALSTSDGWPKRSNTLSTALSRLAPTLRASGLNVTIGQRTGHRRTRTITLETIGKRSSASSASSARGENPHVDAENESEQCGRSADDHSQPSSAYRPHYDEPESASTSQNSGHADDADDLNDLFRFSSSRNGRSDEPPPQQNACVDCGEPCGGARLCSSCAAARVKRKMSA